MSLWHERLRTHRLKGVFSPAWVVRRWKLVATALSVGSYLGNILLAAAAKALFDGLKTGATVDSRVTSSILIFLERVQSRSGSVLIAAGITGVAIAWFAWAYFDARRRLSFLAASKPNQSGKADLVTLGSGLSMNDVSPRRSGQSKAPFVERRARHNQAEVDALDSIVLVLAAPPHPIVLVTGPVGMGKTRLAIEVIKSHRPDSIVFAPRSKSLAPDALSYCKGREVIVIWDDANEHVSVGVDIVDGVDELKRLAQDVLFIFTCSTTALSTLLSDSQPKLKALLSSAQQFELLPLRADGMRRLGAEGTAAQYGNPGMFLSDLDSLKAEFSVMDARKRQLLESSWALFQCGVFPLDSQRVRHTAKILFGLVEDIKDPDDALTWLVSRTFLRSTNPVLVEEFVCQGVLGESSGWNRRLEVLNALRIASDVPGLYQVGVQLADRGSALQEVESVYRDCARIGRNEGSPKALTMGARALVNLVLCLDKAGRLIEEIATTSHEAVAMGKAARTAAGLDAAAKALSNLGLIALERKRPFPEVHDALREAAALGKQSDSQDGWATAAKALYNLGVVSSDSGRPLREVQDAYNAAAECGRKAQTPDGLLLTSGALLNLAAARSSHGAALAELEAIYEEAISCAREADTSEGLALAAKGSVLRAIELGRGNSSIADVKAVYWQGVAYGRTAGTVDGLLAAIRGLAQLSNFVTAQSDIAEATMLAKDLETLGSAATTSEAGIVASQALFNIGNGLVRNAPVSAEQAYAAAELVGEKSGAPLGLVTATTAALNRGRLLQTVGRPMDEIRKAFQQASTFGIRAQTPDGLEMAATAQIVLAEILQSESGEIEAIRSAYVGAAECSTRAGRPTGLVLAARAWSGLAMALDLDSFDEQKHAFEQSVSAGKGSAIAEGLLEASVSLVNLGNLLREASAPPAEIKACYIDATACATSVRSEDGFAVAAGAQMCLAEILILSDSSSEEVIAAYRAAAAFGKESSNPTGLHAASEALRLIGQSLTGQSDAIEVAESIFEDSIACGLRAETDEGLVNAASAAFHWGNFLRHRQEPLARISAAYERSVQLARRSNSGPALGVAASAALNHAVCLRKLGSSPRTALEISSDSGIRAGSSIGLSAAAAAQFETMRGGFDRYDPGDPREMAAEMLVLLLSRINTQIAALEGLIEESSIPDLSDLRDSQVALSEQRRAARFVQENREHLMGGLVDVIRDARARRREDES